MSPPLRVDASPPLRVGPVLIALLLILSPRHAESDTLHATLEVAPSAAVLVPGVPALQAGIQRLFSSQFGSIMSLVMDDPAGTQEPSARVLLDASGGLITVSTDLTREGATRSLASTVPAGSPASLLATICGDLAFLSSASLGFGTLPLSAPPVLVATLATDTLGALTGWNPDELEPVSLAASGDEMVICFPHRWLTLGPLFRITSSTMRDINGQGVAREPLQLSGVVPEADGRVLLLSEHEGRMAIVDPRLGTRQVIDAPGLSALPGRLVGKDTLAAFEGNLGRQVMRLYPLDGRAPRVIHDAASYVPAFDIDAEGNIWAWDSEERRVRVLTPGGQEIFCVRPLLSAGTMPLPQRLAVFDDGSFLLAGSGEVWKFQGSGIPVWRLARIPGRPGESLPPSFDLAAGRSDPSFTILDPQSRRLLTFTSAPSGEAARLGSLLGRLDTRRQADLREVSAFARDSSLGLMALHFGELLVRAGGTELERQAARVALLREKAAGQGDLADGLTRDLLYERADAAWLRTAETLREIGAESPEDQAAAGALQGVVARRREVRAALAGPADIQLLSARALVGHPGPCENSLTLVVSLRNSSSQALRGVRVHAGVPWLSAPSLSSLEEIPPTESRDIRIPLGPVEDAEISQGALLSVFGLVTYERGQEGYSRSLSFTARTGEEGPPRNAAELLACRAVTQDTLAASLEDFLLAGARPEPGQAGAVLPGQKGLDPGQRLVELSGILSALGSARRQQGDAAPENSEGTPRTMRGMLRGLARDEPGWVIVTASIASTLGMRSAVLSAGDRSFALVDTGIPLDAALEGLRSVDHFKQKLADLSAGGTLWIPLSGRAAPVNANAAAWSFVDALDSLDRVDTAHALRAPVSESLPQENVPMPFPLVLPAITERMSQTALRQAAETLMSEIPSP